MRIKPDNANTLVADTEQATLLRVTTETYQHLIGCATGWVIGFSISEYSQFPGCLLWTVPEEKKSHTSTVTSKNNGDTKTITIIFTA